MYSCLKWEKSISFIYILILFIYLCKEFETKNNKKIFTKEYNKVDNKLHFGQDFDGANG